MIKELFIQQLANQELSIYCYSVRSMHLGNMLRIVQDKGLRPDRFLAP